MQTVTRKKCINILFLDMQSSLDLKFVRTLIKNWRLFEGELCQDFLSAQNSKLN